MNGTGLQGLGLLDTVGTIIGASARTVSDPMILAGGTLTAAAGAVALLLWRRVRRLERRAVDVAVAQEQTAEDLERMRRAARTLVDLDTGLPDRRFFDLAVANRLTAARRHLWPVTVVMFELGVDADDAEEQTVALAALGRSVRRTLREADLVCRVAQTTFGAVLEDTPEAGGVWAVERMQIALAARTGGSVRLSAGVATYPTHGLQADEVLGRALEALARARSMQPGRGLGAVEVASVDPAH